MSNENNELNVNESTENVNPEDVSEESVQQDVETEASSTEEGQAETVETKESEKEELTAEEQRRLGKAIKAIRERERAEAARQIDLERQRMAQMQQPITQQAQPDNSVYDPATGEYVSVDSAVGQILVRQQKIAQRQFQTQAQQDYERLSSKAAEGYERFTDYADTHKTFVQLGTDFMAEALKGVDDPAVVINYLGKHSEELKRIAQLPPERQRREIYNVDSKLNPPKKLVSKAPAAVGSVNESNNPSVRAEHQSYNQRADYYAQKYTRR